MPEPIDISTGRRLAANRRAGSQLAVEQAEQAEPREPELPGEPWEQAGQAEPRRGVPILALLALAWFVLFVVRALIG